MASREKVKTADVHDNEEDYGLIRPSLIKQLRSILDQYPDDGQILKELLQNAEDAGAREVKFLYDENSYNTSDLYHPDMVQFQGPSLFAFNNALFEDKDWTGIRMLQDSVKENDPLKVGRFGLGFKSVLHMTDLPSVISGDRLIMIDPHEKYFQYQGDKTSGYSWHLKQKQAAMKKIPNQFEPYLGKFNCSKETFQTGFFDGTLFRFPLRVESSELSDTVYGPDRMSELLSSFEADAHTLLLFLKHLEDIELYRRSKGQSKPQLLFQMRLAPDCLHYVRGKRQDFLDRCTAPDCPSGVTLTYVVFVETLKYGSNGSVDRSVYKWLINEYKSGTNVSAKLQSLQKDPSLPLVPLVGVAMAVDRPKLKPKIKITSAQSKTSTKSDLESDSPPLSEQQEEDKPEGQVFCFLPLPMEQKTATGLPVHVNGYFAISQNRRHLKWPTTGHNIKSDKSIMWNQCLLEELVPVSYIQLLLHAKELAIKSNLVTPDDVYHAMPDLVSVDEKWQIILEPLFNKIFRHPVIYTKASGGRWIDVGDVIFDCMKEDAPTASTVTEVLLKCDVNVSKVPRHVLHALGAYSQNSVEIVSPVLVRETIKGRVESCHSLSWEHSLLLLRYCLKDEDFQDLIGIQLLPLADKRLIAFQTRGEAVFIPTYDAPKELFPGLESCLLADDLDDLLKSKLAKVANEGMTQLRYIDKQAAAMLIPKVIPRDWYNKEVFKLNMETSPIPADWLEHLWTYLRKQYPTDIDMFSGLPVLPLCSTTPLQLVPLIITSPCVMQSAMGVALDERLLPILDIFNIHVIKELPDYVQSHAAVLGNYVKLPFREDLVDVLYQSYKQTGGGDQVFTRLHRDTSALDKQALVEMIASIAHGVLSVACVKFLRNLPIFPSTQSTDEAPDFVSIEAVPRGTDMSGLPCQVTKQLVNITDTSVANAAKLLGIVVLEKKDVLMNYTFDDIKQGKCDQATIKAVMVYIFKRFSDYSEDAEFISSISSIAFVTTDGGKLRKPNELMDPSEQLMNDLGHKELGVFPIDEYAEPQNLIYLRKMGLKTLKTIASKDVLEQMFQVEDIHSSEETADRTSVKSRAILRLLCARPELLWQDAQGKMLLDWANDIAWVPVLQKKPSIFPESLEWYGKHLTAKPSEVNCVDYAPLVGCVRGIVDGDVDAKVQDVFAWRDCLPMQHVIGQLAKIVESFVPKEKAKFLALLTSTYDYLMQKDAEDVCSALKDINLNRWIWFGDGFVALDSIVAQKTILDLSPYVYCLPSEMTAFLELFSTQGLMKQCSPERMVLVLQQISTDAKLLSDDIPTREKLLQQAVDILNYLREQPLRETWIKKILVPVQGVPGTTLNMLPVMSCTYCDVDWIRQGFDMMEFDEQDGIVFIHPNLPVSTAERLGVPTLMSRMLHAEELAITGFGQGEPLTCRLKQLLDDYSDGLAIFKEMIQNADDAGATEVSFMYDERSNEDSMKYLIDEGMKDCQGPALWIHNNSVFTDQDFLNITKLGGATKEQEPEKIGRFGLGFNAVYNITDVPSFISRKNIVIFDPHTRYLGKGIKDRSRPGIKIDMTKNKTLLKKLSDQFRPYQDIFGCNVQADSGGHYDGTLFRLPLRTKQQAANSEISGLHYDKKEIVSLMNLMVKHAHNMLLFTQNLKKVCLYHLPEDSKPSDAKEVFVLEKCIEKVIRQQAVTVVGAEGKNQQDKKEVHMAFLTAAAQYVKKTSKPMTGRLLSVPPVPQSTLLIHTTTTPGSNSLGLNMDADCNDQHWLVSGCVGQESAKKMAAKSKGSLVPVGGVAIHLKAAGKCFVPQHMTSLFKGLTFCFLPLPIATGLPVHINGTFALETSRKHLSQRSDDDKEDLKAEWNEALLEDAVAHAYMQALWDLKQILPYEEEVFFYDIWPTFKASDAYFQPLVNSFYKNMSTLVQMPLCSRKGVIISMSNAVFLEFPDSISPKIAKCIMEAFSQCSGGREVLTLPETVIKSFEIAGYENLLAEKHFDLSRFYEEIFFPNISALGSSLRDAIVVFALQSNSQDTNLLLEENNCIPRTPDGKVLTKIGDLVHPTGLASRLYRQEDGRFPYGEAFVNGNVLSHLQKLGMKVNDVTWGDVIERAESVVSVYEVNTDLGQNRLQNVLAFIDRKLLQSTKYIQSYQGQKEPTSSDEEEILETRDTLRNIQFLHALKKPEIYPISWREEQIGNELFHASDLYPKESRYLVSATQLIADEQHMTQRVKEFLGLTKKDITIEQVMTQLEHVLIIDLALVNADKEYEEIQKSLYAIYKYVQDLLAEGDEMVDDLCSIMKERPCILVGNRFFSPTQLAMNFQYDCSPYLYALPQDTLRRFRPLMTKIGVKENFETKEYIEVLQLLNKESNGKVLDERQLDISLRVTSQLNNSIKTNDLAIEDVIKDSGEIYIPNAKGMLQPSRSLCYNDCPWIKETQVMNFTHPDITFNTSACLGVKTKRQEALRKYAKGIPVGQKEKLTNSLKRILRTYPCNHEILKELIQNADDAQATEIHFIRDNRHHPQEHVFENSWKPLQGPALCVYNNRSFTLEDMQGIQSLGEGSKSRDPSKTGQYGIGFSSVYHLTDAPSLLTTSKEVGKSLCVFDPHCFYVPGATPAEPGMRFENVERLQGAFPDVFGCYLTSQFDMDTGTMFRFPLRTQTMAEQSKISKQHITITRIHNMLEKLRGEAFDILLFTNYLEEIKISDIDPLTGNLVNTYTVKILLSSKQRQMRQELSMHVRESGLALKSGSMSLSDVSRHEYVYSAFLTDTLGKQEKWCVSHTMGFKEGQNIPEVVSEAYAKGDLALMPRGGVACLLEERINGQPDSSNRSMKAFCFLPLPLKTHLPVHVNAHFALGHENRSLLWTNNDGSSDYRKAWNDLVCSSVIAEAYANLLKDIRMHGLAGEVTADNLSVVTCSRKIFDCTIETYMSCFPSFNDDQTEWNILVRNVYQHIAECNVPVLPAVQEHLAADGPTTQLHGAQWTVTWLPPIGEGLDKAFFSKPENEDSSQHQSSSFLSRFKSIFKATPQKQVKPEIQILREVLLDCGLKLVEAPPIVVQNFMTSGVLVDFMSPDGVIKFLRSYSSDKSMCTIGTLPCKLAETQFNNEKTLSIMLRYCKNDPEFKYKLDGLPMLLTEDGILRVFDVDTPVFHSIYSDLVPERGDLFIKKSMLDSFFKDIDLTECPVFQKLDISELNTILPMKLPVAQLRTGKPVEWSKSYNSVPSETWVKRFWSFVKEETKTTNVDGEPSSPAKTPEVESFLSPLSEWSLLPARANQKSYLFPLGDATDVIYYDQVDYKWYGMRDVLRKLRMPELDVGAINMDSSYNSDVAKCMVTTLDRPEAVLQVLKTNLVGKEGAPEVTKEEASRLLRYFVQNITGLQGDEQSIAYLRELPLYTTIYGDMISLTNCVVYTLPAKIPTQGIDIWQSCSGTVFLERDNELQALYDYLGCASISVLDVYCKFIFQHLEYFPEEDRMVHLHHVYSKYIKDGASHQQDLSADERENLQTVLKEMAFVDVGSGELQPASEFYDPENVVFKVMLPEDRFPPPPKGHLFKESEWYDFLGKLGLVREMNRDMYVGFANQVASEGHLHDKNSALAKSKVLVQHLYTMSSASKEAIMPDISEIKFVAQGTASPKVTAICPQYGDVGVDTLHFASFRDSVCMEYENLVWTQATLLPDWADPGKLHNLPASEKLQIMTGLQIQKSPQLKVVVRHLLALCERIRETDPNVISGIDKILEGVFKDIYRYLQNTMSPTDEEIQTLSKESIILVSGGRLVKPSQTVVNLFEGDEIRPYLYKIPLLLGEFVQLFKLLGTTEIVSVDQYGRVLEAYKQKVRINRLSPNELRGVFKAMKGVLEQLESHTSRDVSVPVLFLPNECGRLVDTSKLVFNDAPSFYDRVKDFGLQFVVDPRECGLKSHHADELLAVLPQRVRPGMLSAFVKEELMEDSKQSKTKEGLARILDERVQSEIFLTAVARLVRHEAQKTGKKVDDRHMFQVLDRLSTIHVFGVSRVVTHLTFKDEHIEGSNVDKACYVEKLQGHKTDMFQWHLYIQKDSSLGQDLLVPLAEIINNILSGMLRDSVLYLLPILSCPTDQIQAKLDSLNIRLDRVLPASRVSLLPALGSPVEGDYQIKWGEIDFEVGEYVGFKQKETSDVIHAQVKEEVMSPADNRVYLVETGQGHDAVIALASQLFKYN